MRQGGLDQAHMQHQAQIHAFLPGGLVQGVDAPGRRSARVGDEDVQPAEGLHGLCDQFRGHVRQAHIPRQPNDLRACFLLQLLSHGLNLGRVPPVDGDLAALFGKCYRGGIAQSAGGTGNQGAFVFES